MDKQIAKTCHARHGCKQRGILCGTGCPLWIEIRYQNTLSGIPKRHQKHTIDDLQEDTVKLEQLHRFKDNIMERVEAGQGLYLYGNTGSGKTTALSALALSYIVEASKQALRTGKRTKQFVQFINIPDLLDGLKRGFDDPEIAREMNHKLTMAADVPLLIIDDIGSEKPTEWARERLTQLIGSRYDQELSTFISSNLTLPELKEHIDPVGRITSRIKGMAIPLRYEGKDRRNIL